MEARRGRGGPLISVCEKMALRLGCGVRGSRAVEETAWQGDLKIVGWPKNCDPCPSAVCSMGSGALQSSLCFSVTGADFPVLSMKVMEATGCFQEFIGGRHGFDRDQECVVASRGFQEAS